MTSFRIKYTEFEMPVVYSNGDIKWVFISLVVELIRILGSGGRHILGLPSLTQSLNTLYAEWF